MISEYLLHLEKQAFCYVSGRSEVVLEPWHLANESLQVFVILCKLIFLGIKIKTTSSIVFFTIEYC